MFCIFIYFFLPTFSKIEYFSWSQKQKAATPSIKVERQPNKSETISEPESGPLFLGDKDCECRLLSTRLWEMGGTFLKCHFDE